MAVAGDDTDREGRRERELDCSERNSKPYESGGWVAWSKTRITIIITILSSSFFLKSRKKKEGKKRTLAI